MSRFPALAAATFFLTISLTAAIAQVGAGLRSYLSAASNNSTLVITGPRRVSSIAVVNTTATIYYLKLYDKATAPTCGTDTPVWRLPIPSTGGTTGGVIAPVLPIEGLQFQLGLGFCLVAGIADNDNTNAATGVAINLAIQ